MIRPTKEAAERDNAKEAGDAVATRAVASGHKEEACAGPMAEGGGPSAQ